MVNHTTFRGSSQIGEFLLLGVEEIIGRSGLNAVSNLTPEAGSYGELNKRMDYADVSAVMTGLEKIYGPRGGRGVALRAGRAGFKYLLRQNGMQIGLIDLNFRLLPVPSRLKTGLKALAGWMGSIGDEQVSVKEEERFWVWRSESCPLCWGRVSSEPVCHFTVGLLQEFFTWASGGRIYSLREVACRAVGAPACLIKVDRKALD